MSHISHPVLPQATEPLTLLESITEVPDWQVIKMSKSSRLYLLTSSFFFPPLFCVTISKKATETSHNKVFCMKASACRNGTPKNNNKIRWE